MRYIPANQRPFMNKTFQKVVITPYRLRNEFLEIKHDPVNQPRKSRKITTLTFFEKKGKISLKTGRLRTSLTMKNLGKYLFLGKANSSNSNKITLIEKVRSIRIVKM